MLSQIPIAQIGAFGVLPRTTSRTGKAVLVFSLSLVLASSATVVRGQSALDGFDPNVNGIVYVSVVQPDGRILIGGAFTMITPNGGGPVPRNRIARLNPDGTLDAAFNPSANDSVNTIAVQNDGKILVGGSFTSIGGQSRNRMARLDANTGAPDSFDPHSTDSDITVYSIAVQTDGRILVGGNFSNMGGQARNGVARLDAATGLADSLDPNANGGLNSIVLQGDGKILASGAFSSIGGQTRHAMARLDPITGLADSFNPDLTGTVSSVVAQPDGKVLAGGSFSPASGPPSNGLARWNSDGTRDSSFISNANNRVDSIALQADGKILAAGVFTTIGGQTRKYLARLDTTTGAADSFNPNPNSFVSSVAVQPDGKIFAGGDFTNIGGQTRNRIARLETDGSVDRTLNVSASGTYVLATAVQPDGKILVGGLFTSILGVERQNIARLNGDGTLDLAFDASVPIPTPTSAPPELRPVPALAPPVGPTGRTVYTIALQADGKILAGGSFTNIGGQWRSGIARLDPITGAADSFNPNVAGEVLSILVQADGKILVGGLFDSVGGQTRNNIARLDPITGAADSFNPNANSFVFTMAEQPDGKILVGGRFVGSNSIGGQTRSMMARLDPVTGLADSFDPNANADVASIVVQADGRILVGGNFSGPNSIGGATRNRIARLDPTTGAADSFNPNASDFLRTITMQSDGKILIGGAFTDVGGQARNHIARLDPVTGVPDSFNPNANDGISSIVAHTDGKILVGGSFTSVGGQTRNLFARLSNDTTASQDLSAAQNIITWLRSGSSPQLLRVTFEYSTDGVSYVLLGNGTASGSNWTLTGLSLPTGQNFYIRARGYYRGGHFNSSDSITELVRYGPAGPPLPTPTPTPTVTPTPTPCPDCTPTPTPTPTPSVTPCPSIQEGFANIASLVPGGWFMRNNSSEPGTTGWFQGNSNVFPARSGDWSSYIAANFNNGMYASTLSNWLVTPPLTVQNGLVLTFWTRTVTTPSFPDRLQVRMSTNGSSTNVGTTATGMGDFSTLLLDINPTYTTNGYPHDWAEFTVTLSGLGSPTIGRLALRYFVQNGGPDGINSDYIGIDRLQIAGPCQPTPTPEPEPSASPGPGISVNPHWGTFGSAMVGSSSGPIGFQVVGPLDVQVSLSDTTNFSITENACEPTPSPGLAATSCFVSVTFHPVTAGPKSAELTASGSCACNPDHAVLTGTGRAAPTPSPTEPPPVWFKPDHNDFGSVMVGSSSDPFTFTLYVIGGNGPDGWPGIYLEGPDASSFSFTVKTEISGPNLLTQIPVTVTFSPITEGPKYAYLSASCGACNPGTANLTGAGAPCPACTPTPTPTSIPAQAINLSTRLLVGTGNEVGIGGFIVTGTSPKQVLLRGIGPSLGNAGVPNPLADPTLELRDASGALLVSNDDWCRPTPTPPDNQCNPEIIATGAAPTDPLESAILTTLNPGAYTAILAGKNKSSGIALVELYDLNQAAASKLGNISTRGFVGTGDSTVIAGFILGAAGGDDRIVLRGLGPSVAVPNPLPNPRLELRDSAGALIGSDEDWMDDANQAAEIIAAGLAPSNNLEAAMVANLPPGAYTALLMGSNNGAGIGLLEVYDQVPGPTPTPSPRPDRVTLEAEDALLTGCYRQIDPQASNGYRVDGIDVIGDSVEFTQVPAGNHLVFRYATPNTGQMSLYVNNIFKTHVDFESTPGGWVYPFVDKEVITSIPEGSSVKLQFNNGDVAINLDYIQIHSVGPTPTPIPTPLPACGSFANSAPIAIPASGIGSPYPSNITVSGLGGAITKVTVAINGITHSVPADIDVLLLGPDGHNAIIMSDVGGSNPVTGVNVVLDDAASTPLPNGGLLVSGTFQPTNIDACDGFGNPIDTFPAPAPTPSRAVPLSVFDGTNPNGTWSLYVVDDRNGEAGSFAAGWAITITTDHCIGPTATPVPTPTPGGATHFAIDILGAVLGGFPFDFRVTALDQFNNTVTAYPGVIHFASSDHEATLPGDGGLTNGTGIFSAVLGQIFTYQTITATDSSNPEITGTSYCIFIGKTTPTPPPTPTPPGPTPTPGTCTENFDGVTAPALPANWVASNPVPGDGVMFVTSIDTPNSGPNDAFIPDQDGISDKVLDRLNVTVNSASPMLTFRNNFDSEMSGGVFWDGGVLEISAPNISNGDFLDITDSRVGGSILSGGYTGEISSDAQNPLAGRMAWSGNSGGYINTAVSLGPNLNGQTITLRWRFGADEAVEAPGWRIDNLSIVGMSCP